MHKVDLKNNLPDTGFNKRKSFLFKTISILVPLFLLLFVEFSLQLFHYGNNLDLFIESPLNKEYLIFNPHASEKYFTNPLFATTGNSEQFKKIKDPGTMRFFVLGESTTLGYPGFHNASFHRWLLYRLSHTFPNKNFEIINLSLTAVNSYTILGFSKEIVKYNPDAVLIYVGHNEYYGAMGVGSTQMITGNSTIINLMLELRKLRTVQLLSNLYTKISGHSESKPGDSKKVTRLSMMVEKQQIPVGSKLYQRGISQFCKNMNSTLSILSEHHIPVFISNLVSNEKDLQPFVSASLSEDKKFKNIYNAGVVALDKKDTISAYTIFQQVNKVIPGSADIHFILGQLAYRQKDFSKAKNYFIQAKELDELRFRAPEILNKIIFTLSNQYPNVYLVDTKSLFEKNSLHQIIGNELVIDHVHPSLKGYSIMSDAFYLKMKEKKIFPVIHHEDEMSYNVLLEKMPQNKVDSLTGVYRIRNLKGHWPFKDDVVKKVEVYNSFEEKTAHNIVFNKTNWTMGMNNLYSFYINENRLNEARKVAEGLTLEYVYDPVIFEKAAMINGKLGNDRESVFYFKKSFELSPSFDKARYLFVLYLKIDEPEESVSYLQYAISHNEQNLNLNPVRQSVERVIQLKRELQSDTTDVGIMRLIAGEYLKMGNQAGALRYTSKVLKSK